jgi:large subunit ribosomal protein L29
MPMKRMREIREISDEERLKRLSELRTELVRMKTMVKAGGAVENPSRIRELRKTIARIETVRNEKTERGKQE